MKDKKRTKEDLIKELNLLRRQLVELKEAGIKRKTKEDLEIEADKRTAELKYERDKLIKVFEAMEDGVYIVNQQYGIEYINPVLEKEFGPWKGIKCYTYFHDRTEVCPWCPNKKVFAGETVRWEWYSFKNGKTYDLIDSPLRNPDGTISKLEIFRDITEWKKTVESLKRSRKEWEGTFDAITDPLFIHDKEFKIVRANRAYQNAAGMEFSEIIGKPYYKVFPKMEGPFRMCLKVQELQEEEFFYPITDSVFKVRFYPIKDVNGSYLYSIHIIEEITEAKHNAEKIKEAEIRYRTIFEQSPAGILIIDPETFLPIEFNDAASRQLGYSREEFAKLRVSDYEVIDSPEEIEARAERLLREGKDSFETKHRTKNSEIRNVIVTIQTLMLSGKAFFYCVFRDITEIRQAEERIRRSEELLRLQIQRMPIGCIVWNTEFCVITWNPAAERIFGFSANETTGKHPYEIIVPKEAQPHVDTVWRRLLEGDETAHSINENQTKDGRTILCEWTNTPLRNHEGTVIGVLSMVEDITESKKAEEKLKKQLEELERFKKATIQRELRMKELKEKVEKMEMEKEKDSPE